MNSIETWLADMHTEYRLAEPDTEEQRLAADAASIAWRWLVNWRRHGRLYHETRRQVAACGSS